MKTRLFGPLSIVTFFALRLLLGCASHEDLLREATRGNTAVVQALLAQGTNVNVQDTENKTALMLAAFEGHTGTVQTLLSQGAAVNNQDKQGTTALMLASSQGHMAIVQALLAGGAKSEAKNQYGWTALMLAVAGGHPSTAKILVANGADVHAKNHQGMTALRLAELKGLSTILQQRPSAYGQGTEQASAQSTTVQTGRVTEQASRDLEEARLFAGTKAHEAEQKAREFQQARLMAEQKAREAKQKADELEQARLMAEQKAREFEQNKEQAAARVPSDQAIREMEQKARELQQAHLFAEQKAREFEQKAHELEHARLMAEQKAREAEQKAYELEQAHLMAEQKAQTEEQAKLRAEQKVHELEQARLLTEQKLREVQEKVQEQERAMHVAEQKVRELEQVRLTERPLPDTVADAIPSINFGQYHALVIGNNDYIHLSKLETAVNDAKTVAETLQQAYGFSVTLLLEGTREQIILALDQLRSKLTEKDNLLIYYAGHGYLDTAAERGYWLPVNAHEDTRVNWISTTELTDTLRAMTAKHVILVADSCYSGTLVRDSEARLVTGMGRTVYLERIAKKRSRTVLTSGGLEPVLDSGAGNHSVFAKAFLTALLENNGVIDGQQFFQNIRRLVVVNAPQTPEYSDVRNAGHDGGDFLFVRRRVS